VGHIHVRQQLHDILTEWEQHNHGGAHGLGDSAKKVDRGGAGAAGCVGGAAGRGHCPAHPAAYTPDQLLVPLCPGCELFIPLY